MDTITKVMSSLNDGMSINATSRIFQISRNTVRSWLDKLGNTVIILSVSTFC
ncbi:MAG: helix-turn-helix domain-containing protein [Zetaproteobacteria bacterium]|nr:helix-turn-helix domain-containing protein [Zetaproteobacteria bacterium]